MQFDWVLSTEIFEEYAEKLGEFYSDSTADYVLDMLCNANNTIFAEPYYQWDLITSDPDDNKFSNLALSVNAHCLVTYDRRFNIFTTLDFPKLNVLNPKQYKRFLAM